MKSLMVFLFYEEVFEGGCIMNCNFLISIKFIRYCCQFEGEIKNEVVKLGLFENKGVVNVIFGNDG